MAHSAPSPEAWLRGPVPGIDPLLQPAAHALVQAREDLERLTDTVPPGDVWTRPGGAASIGFHVRHLGGALDRLLTYARGEMLSSGQLAALKAEGSEHEVPLGELVSETSATIDRALAQLRATPPDSLLTPQRVGRSGLPSTTLGLIFHAAEHSTRHAGQALTTAKILAGRVEST